MSTPDSSDTPTPPAPNRPTHRPGPGGVMGSMALCGASVVTDEILRMHEYDYDCAECARLSGEPTRLMVPKCSICGGGRWIIEAGRPLVCIQCTEFQR